MACALSWQIMLKVNVRAFCGLSLGQASKPEAQNPKPAHPGTPECESECGRLAIYAIVTPAQVYSTQLHASFALSNVSRSVWAQSSDLSSAVVPAHNLILIGLTAGEAGQSPDDRCQAIWLCMQLITWAPDGYPGPISRSCCQLHGKKI